MTTTSSQSAPNNSPRMMLHLLLLPVLLLAATTSPTSAFSPILSSTRKISTPTTTYNNKQIGRTLHRSNLNNDNGDYYQDYYNVNYDEDYRRAPPRAYDNDYYDDPVPLRQLPGESYYDDDQLEYGPYNYEYYYGNDFWYSRKSVTRHLWIVIVATFWWYFYSSFEMVAHPPAGKDFFNMNKDSLQTLGGLLAFVPLPIYFACTQLGRARSVRQAQWLILGMVAVAVPADMVIAVLNPTHSRGWTAVGFIETTLFLGVYVVHHLRQASYREFGYYSDEDDAYFWEAPSPMQAVMEYRPPPYYQSVQVAADMARSMVAFVVACAVIGQTLATAKNGLAALFPFNEKLWPWVLVAIHAGNDCILHAVCPGAQLRRFGSYLAADTALYAMHVYAAFTTPAIQNWLSSSGKSHLADQALVIWFVANAATQLLQQGGRLFQSVDFDRRFGLSNGYYRGGEDFLDRYRFW